MSHDRLHQHAGGRGLNLVVGATFAGLLWVGASALASPAQEQACAGEVAYMHDIPMSEIRVAHTGSSGGVARVLVTYHGGNARCTVQPNGDVTEVRWNVHDSGGGAASAPRPDKAGQEQACAGRMAEEVNEPMSRVRVISTTELKHGHTRVKMESPGMRASCTVDANFKVVGFKFLPYN